jgi:endonuclease/exonuclease/phosphatase family metal-dependent hydrolase
LDANAQAAQFCHAVMAQIETGSFSASELTERPTTLRVVSWNIARGSKQDAIVEFLFSADADIIFLQESDKNARRTSYRNVAREISQRLSMNYVFGCEFEELAQGTRASPAYHGQATLSRWPLSHSRILRFRNQSKFWHPHWLIPRIKSFQRRLGGRMALLSEVRIPDGTLVTYNLHLESRGGDGLRACQIREFLYDARSYSSETRVLAAGDFNLDISQGVAAALLSNRGFHNPFSTLHEPTAVSRSLSVRGRAIDWILMQGPLVGANPQIHSSVGASDHYPLSLTLELSSSSDSVRRRPDTGRLEIVVDKD